MCRRAEILLSPERADYGEWESYASSDLRRQLFSPRANHTHKRSPDFLPSLHHRSLLLNTHPLLFRGQRIEPSWTHPRPGPLWDAPLCKPLPSPPSFHVTRRTRTQKCPRTPPSRSMSPCTSRGTRRKRRATSTKTSRYAPPFAQTLPPLPASFIPLPRCRNCTGSSGDDRL